MLRRCLTLLWLCLLLAHPVRAQGEDAVRRIEALPDRFSAAWAKHDGGQLAQLMADNVDFVTVGGAWLHGRQDFQTYHTRLLSGRFKESTIAPLERRVRFIRPDLAILRWSWRIEGDREFDGTPRPPRFGIFTMLVELRGGDWLIIAAQNTNGGPGTAPENEGLTFPIALPRPDHGPQH